MIRPHGVLAVCERNARVHRRTVWASLLGHIGEPLFYIVVFGYGLGRFIGDFGAQSFLEWLIPGVAVIAAATSGGLECTYSAFTRMERQKTYLAIASTPVSIEEVVVGEALWGAVLGLINAILTLLVAALFGALFAPFHVILILAASFLGGLLAASVALLFTSCARGYEDFAIFFTVILTPSLILSGAYFPLEVFPPALLSLAHWLPFTQPVEAARAAGGQGGLKLLATAAWTLPFLAGAVHRIARRVIV